MRSFEELDSAVYHAATINDIQTLLACAEELDAIDTPQAEALAWRARGRVHLLRGERDRAQHFFLRALDVYTQLGDSRRVAVVLINLGILSAAVGDFAGALEHFHGAIARYEMIGDDHGVAIVTMNVGAVHASVSDYPMAIEHFHKALTQFEASGDDVRLANALSNIGAVLANTNSVDQGLDHYRRALAIHEKLGDVAGTIDNYLNIGSALYAMGEHSSALASYQHARQLAVEQGLIVKNAIILCNLGRTHLAMRNVPEAEDILKQLDTIELVDPGDTIEREHLRASLQREHGLFDDATSTAQHIVATASAYGLRSQAAEAHKLLRDLALATNNLAAYVEHSEAFSTLVEEVNGKDTATKLAMHAKQREIDAREREHEKHLAVLHSTLPKHIADRVARGEQVNDHYDTAAVIFLDIVDFTTLADKLSSTEVIQLLDTVFTELDAICKKHDVVKIKTIGDSYMAVAFPSESSSSEQQTASVVERAAHAALEMLSAVSMIMIPNGSPEGSPERSHVSVRIGVHCGAVTAGVLGKERLQYDVWGDTVNVASRMESTGEPGRIHVSEQFASFLGLRPRNDSSSPIVSEELGTWHLALRGETELKGKGVMTTYWLERPLP